ncbi:hypothetical protein EYF80_017935 [Liparis tanakae]|uniref:Uncharacterized protein n=1 Tax=Liparis tanakae TaxID=230148 RepID=A0A4Z2I369_9TELE|nr:hypothetical protein EYF80_017935 [Liparis tanakae]
MNTVHLTPGASYLMTHSHLRNPTPTGGEAAAPDRPSAAPSLGATRPVACKCLKHRLRLCVQI